MKKTTQDPNGTKRTIHYFGRQAETTFFQACASVAALSVYLSLINGEGNFISLFWTNLKWTLPFMSLVILFANGMTMVQTLIPLAVSHGCRRKNAFWGCGFMNLILIGQCLFVIGIGKAIDGELEPVSIAIYIGSCLGAEGLCKCVGMLAARYGRVVYKLAMVIFIFISMGIGGVIGFASVSSIKGAGSDIMPWAGILQLSSGTALIVLAVGIALCIIGNAVTSRLIRAYEVL